jgi:hypothetical protein
LVWDAAIDIPNGVISCTLTNMDMSLHMLKFPPVSINSPMSTTRVVAEMCCKTGVELGAISNDAVDEMDESSSVISSVLAVAIVTFPSGKNSEPSWKSFGANGLSQQSSNDPGGGGSSFSNHIESVDDVLWIEELLETVEELSSFESDEEVCLSSGTSKRESSADVTLSLSGAVASVIKSVVWPTLRLFSIIF